MKKNEKKPSGKASFQFKIEYLEWAALILLFLILRQWIRLNGAGANGPDEEMRYYVVKYLYEHPGSLPRGDDPKLIDDMWGFSYALYPFLSSMGSAVLMWIQRLFNDSNESLHYAARMANVLYVLIAGKFAYMSGRKLWGGMKGFWLGTLILFLPGFHYLGTYINSDALGLTAAAILFYAGISVIKEGWSWKNCIWLSVGMSVCLLSYYYAYGWVLCSFFYFVLTILLCEKMPFLQRVKFMITRGLVISAVTIGLAGWHFVRNFLIYDGDVLAMDYATELGNKNGVHGLSPATHFTPAKAQWNWKQLVFYQNPGWEHNWLMMTLYSFAGAFGIYNIFMNETVNRLYLLFMALGIAGTVFLLHEFDWRRRQVSVTKQRSKTVVIRTKVVHRYREGSREGLFHWMLVLTMIIPAAFFVYSCYYNDIQAQGRYLMAGVFGVMYFTVRTYAGVIERFVKDARKHEIVYGVLSLIWILAAVANYYLVVLPAY